MPHFYSRRRASEAPVSRIRFVVEDPDNQRYQVEIEKNGHDLNCHCNCAMGAKRLPCKHWMNVFDGKAQRYFDVSSEQINQVKDWLHETDIEEVWKELTRNKQEEQRILDQRKKIIERFRKVMWD